MLSLPRSISLRHSVLTLSLAVSLAAPVGIARAEEVEIDRFERTTVYANLVQPMELDIAPDGRIFLIEIGGTIRLIDPDGDAAKVVGELDVTTAQENGLIGLALDPDFASNGWLYLQYSPPEFEGQRVSRFTFREDRVDLASEQVLFSYQEQRRECCHHAGSLEFGPDGNLYIGTGDNTNPFDDSQGYAPLDERPGREPWDAQRTAGNTKSYNGKVLRIRPEPDGTYSIPEGNLFPKDGSLGHPEIYVMGCRNPWRISIDPRTGYLYWGDVGPDAGQDGPRGPRGYDEINQARSAGNHGWPYFIGDNYAYPIVDFATGAISEPLNPQSPMNRSVNNTGATELPAARPAMIYYPAAPSEKFPALGSGGRTACAGPVYYFDPDLDSPTKFPAAYHATLFTFEWSRNTIQAAHLDADSNLAKLEPFLPEMQFARPIDLQFDAQGSLYVIEYGETWGVNPDARLVRIDYVRGNRAPVAVATAENAAGQEPLKVTLRAEGSADKDGDSLRYQWTAIRSGTADAQRQIIGTTPELTVPFDQPGVYTIELKVEDPEGATDVTTLPVIVGNARPHVEFIAPLDGDFYTPGEAVEYQLVVRDREDGTSDVEQAQEDPWHFIDGTAPSRLFVEATPAVTGGENTPQADSPGMALIRKSDCLNCHAADRPLVGPSFLAIADKYRDQPHQLDESVKRILNGSSGVWGKVGMLPHAQHTPAEVRRMVEHVFSVTADNSAVTARGFRNRIETDPESGNLRLSATYTDLGRNDIPRLTGVASITLRSRRQQAESADAFHGTKPLASANAEGSQFMGAIEHDGFLKFARVPLDGMQSITARVASAGAGGTIEIRRGSTDGPRLGSAAVTVNGQWETFYELPIALEETSGIDDLYIVFKNAENRGGLMNVDSLVFGGR